MPHSFPTTLYLALAFQTTHSGNGTRSAPDRKIFSKLPEPASCLPTLLAISLLYPPRTPIFPRYEAQALYCPTASIALCGCRASARDRRPQPPSQASSEGFWMSMARLVLSGHKRTVLSRHVCFFQCWRAARSCCDSTAYVFYLGRAVLGQRTARLNRATVFVSVLLAYSCPQWTPMFAD